MRAPTFALVWTSMMAVMMVPSEVPFASRYARMHGPVRVRALAFFLAGYVAVWGLTAWPAFGLTELSGRLAHGRTAVAVGVAAFAGLALYQLTPWKQRCLRRCRPPFGLLLRYSSWRGRLRSSRAGVHHALSCVGCCWALMAVLALLGLMSALPMIAAGAVVAGEKLWTRGIGLSRAVGGVALVLAVAALWMPGLAPGLHGTAM